MKTTVSVPPDGEPVSLSAVKEYLRIGHAGEDALITSLIEAARARLETELGIVLVTRVLTLELEAWPGALTQQGFRLKPGPVSSLRGVVSVSSDGHREDLISRFMLTAGRLCVRPWSFVPAIETGGHVEVHFETGHGAPDALPDDLVLAVKMLAAQGYHLRDGGREGDEDALPVEIDELLAPYQGVRL